MPMLFPLAKVLSFCLLRSNAAMRLCYGFGSVLPSGAATTTEPTHVSVQPDSVSAVGPRTSTPSSPQPSIHTFSATGIYNAPLGTVISPLLPTVRLTSWRPLPINIQIAKPIESRAVISNNGAGVREGASIGNQLTALAPQTL